MSRVLRQDQIDVLFHPAAAAAHAGAGSGITPVNFRTVGQVSLMEVSALTRLHESFARNLTHALSAYLRVVLELNLTTVEQLTYGEFLRRVPDVTYLSTLRLLPLDAIAAVQMDLAVGFPIIDLLLGGQGNPDVKIRPVTDIEEGILENIVRVLARELQSSWQPILEQEILFEQRWLEAQVFQFLPANEKVLVLAFEVRLPDTHGMLHILLPALAASVFLRKFSQERSQKRRGTPENEARLRSRLLQCPFQTELLLPTTAVTVRELLELEAGQILTLDQPAESAAYLTVAGRQLYWAQPARTGGQRAAQIQRRVPLWEKGKSHDEEEEE